MPTSPIHSIAIIGAGVMGTGIAQVALQSGFDTILFDINPDILKKAESTIQTSLDKLVEKGRLAANAREAMRSRIRFTGSIQDVVADVIVEAILENLELKRKVLKEIEAQNAPGCIIASNTSTIPITQIAAGLQRPHQVVGMHFFNPAPIMKLVEVIAGEMTAPGTRDMITQLAGVMGKTAVQVKDEPGFIVNRVARHFYLESLRILEEQTADVAGIDAVMKNAGFKMGPFELMDLIGVETNHEVTKSLYNAFFQDEKFRPSRVQQKKVDAGHYGRKTGRGFYEYGN